MSEETKKTIRVRIQDDGEYKYNSTKITDAETGTIIDGIAEATITMSSDGATRAQLTVCAPVLDIIADAEIRHVCPVCGRDETQQKNQYIFVGDIDKAAEERISKRVLANLAEQVRTQGALRRTEFDRDRRG